MDLLGDFGEESRNQENPNTKSNFQAQVRHAPAVLLGRVPAPLIYSYNSNVCYNLPYGDVAEWLNAPVSKTGIPKGIVSSNLTVSADFKNYFSKVSTRQ